MSILPLDQVLRKHIPEEKFDYSIRALMQDELIWRSLNDPKTFENVDTLWSQSTGSITPAALALFVVDPSLVESGYPEESISSLILEEAMLGFESYQGQRTPLNSLREAGLLAVALNEKFRQSGDWGKILYEILHGAEKRQEAYLTHFWKTAFAILVGLCEDPAEFNRALFETASDECVDGLFSHLVLVVPASEDDRASLVVNSLYSTMVKTQAEALQSLYRSSDFDLVKKAAKGLLSRHLITDLQDLSADEIWMNSAKYLGEGSCYRELAAIAQFAGELGTAEKLLKINEKILKTELAGNLIQSASLKAEKGESYAANLESLPADCLEQDEIVREISYLGPDSLQQKIASHDPIYEINEAVKIFRAGNEMIAKETAAKSFELLNNNASDKAFRAIQWLPINVLKNLNELGLWQEAAGLSHKLLQAFPTNESLLQEGLNAAEKQNDFTLQLKTLERLDLLDTTNDVYKRKLASAYLHTEDWPAAYEMYKLLVNDLNSAEQEDLLGLAKSALKCEDIPVALENAQKVLSTAPENSQALAISGYAYHKQGQFEKAIDLLDRAIEVGAEDAEPWLLKADLYANAGETAKSVTALRSGLTAHPDNDEIKKKLVKTLLANGQASDALAVLNENQASEFENREFAVLKIQAMKQISSPELANTVEKIYHDLPSDPEIIKEYAAVQLQKGNREPVKHLLQPFAADTSTSADLKLVYCDAILGEDYHQLHSSKSVELEGCEDAEELLHQVLLQNPENIYARMLLAESNIHHGKSEKAFEFMTTLLGDPQAQNSNWFQRIQAGFAWAASLLGKADVALGAIQNVVGANPNWAGASQTLAEIDASTGEIADAVNQAENVLQVAPDVVQSAEWFANFMGNLGKNEEAEKILANTAKTHKDKNPLLLKLAELKVKRNELSEAKGIAEGLKHSLPKMKMDGELLQAAKLFNSLGEKQTAEECLKTRVANPAMLSANAYTDLAGFFRTNGQPAQALEILDQAEKKYGTQKWIQLLKSETKHFGGDAQSAMDLLSDLDNANNFMPDRRMLVFLPEEWKPLLQEETSTDELIRNLAFESGNYREAMADDDRVETEPLDITLQIEVNYALGSNRSSEQWRNVDPEDESIYRTYSLAAQFAEILLDAGLVEKAGQVIKRGLELFPDERSLTANASRYSGLVGDVQTAEALFDQILPQYSCNDKYTGVLSVCALRNLLKTAISLNRWVEALSWQRILLQAQQHNQAALQLSMQTLVQSLEFSHITEGLGLRQHFDAAPETVQIIAKELSTLMTNPEIQKNSRFSRWTARAKVVLEPNQANIRSLALVTPEADDVAAMMMGLHRSGQTTTALQLAKKFEGAAPVKYITALCLKDSDPQKSVETLKANANSMTVLPWSHVLAENLYRKLGENYSAVNEMEEAIQWWPTEPEWHVMAAECWQKTGDAQNAISHLEQAEKILPEDGRVKFLLGKAYLQAKDIEKSIEILDSASKKAANHYETWETLAEAYYESGKKDLALQAAEKASSINGFSIKPLLLSAKIQLDNGEIKKALELVQEAVKHDEQDAEGQVILAKVWMANGNKMQALQALEKASKGKNASIQTLIEQAKLIQQVNGAASARVMLESLEQKYPENLEVLDLLAEAQLANGDKAAAEGTAQRSLKLQEFQPKLQQFVGKLELEGGHLDQAVHHFSQAIAQGDQEVDVYLDLSKAYMQQRDFDSALQALESAIELSPKDIRPIVEAANLLRNGKDYTKAEGMLRRAAEISPNDLNIRRQLGAVIALNLVHSSQEASSNI